jgi:hypothetical protein
MEDGPRGRPSIVSFELCSVFACDATLMRFGIRDLEATGATARSALAGKANLANTSETDVRCSALSLAVTRPGLDDTPVSASIYFVGKAESRFPEMVGDSLGGARALSTSSARKASLRKT